MNIFIFEKQFKEGSNSSSAKISKKSERTSDLTKFIQLIHFNLILKANMIIASVIMSHDKLSSYIAEWF